MASFSPSEVAMTGFGVVRRNPQAVTIWAVLTAVFQLATTFVLISVFGPSLNELENFHATGAASDGPAVLALLGKLSPFLAAAIALGIPAQGVVSALMNRVVLRPKESAFGYLRFGVDEFRQISLALLIFAVLIGAYIAFAIATVIILIIAGLLQKAIGEFGSGLIGFLGIAALVIFAIAVVIRLSLASALTFDKGRVDLFGSWPLTKGHAWSILGAHFLSAIIYLFVLALGYIVIFGVASALGGGDVFQTFFHQDNTSVASYFTPARIVIMLLGAPLAAITFPITRAVSPAIYQALTKSEF